MTIICLKFWERTEESTISGKEELDDIAEEADEPGADDPVDPVAESRQPPSQNASLMTIGGRGRKQRDV